MKVYLDILLIENLVINYSLLLITLQVTKANIKYGKLFIAALIGALYTLCIVVPKLHIFAAFPLKILVSLAMVFICCYNGKLIDCIKRWVVFILMSFLLCGLFSCIAFYENSFSISEGLTINKISSKYFILALMLFYIVCFRIVSYIKNKIVVDDFVYSIQVQYGSNSVSFKGFLDTGNELIEPVTMLPVILVEHKIIDSMLIKNNNFYMVKYTTISGSEGSLKGFVPDKILIKCRDATFEKKAVICPCYEKLSNCNEYSALISRGLL